MRLEVRSSGGKTCGQCGAHELLSVPEGLTREDVALDITAFLEEQVIDVEQKLMKLFEEEQRRTWLSVEEHSQKLEHLLGAHYAWYRPFREHWRKKLLHKVLDATDELRERTAKA